MKNSFKSILVVIICLAGTAPGASFSSPQATSPRIDSVSASTPGRAGRLRIFGANFGAIEPGSQVLIGGVRAPVSRWSDTLVGLPGYFKAFSTSGQFLWQINLPGEPYPGMFEFPFERGRFSPDGATV